MCEYILKLCMTKTNYSLSSYYFTLNSWQCTATHNQGWECTKIKKGRLFLRRNCLQKDVAVYTGKVQLFIQLNGEMQMADQYALRNVL